jgi:hypothetical protein
MARAAGKRSKKRGKRRGPSRSRNRAAGNISLAEAADARDEVDAKISARVPAVYAFADSNDSDPFAANSPAFDRPELLPELVCLQLMAIQHFKLHPMSPSYPPKQALMDFFMNTMLSNRTHLSSHLASAMATFVRPIALMAGGRPGRQQKPAGHGPDPEKRLNRSTVFGEKG